MTFDRRSFLAAAVGTLAAPAAFAQSVAPKEKFTVILDWFVNPDHAPLFTARYIGAFDRAGLDVVLVPPTDPDLPPRLLAAGKADAALSYQTQLYLLVDQGLPLRRTGTLIDKPLNTLTALQRSGITKLADLKGKKIGYSVAGVEEALIGTMLRHVGLSLSDVAGQRAGAVACQRDQWPVGAHPLDDAEAQLVRHERGRPGRAQPVELGAVLAAERDQVGEALGGDERGTGAGALEQSVGGDRHPV